MLGHYVEIVPLIDMPGAPKYLVRFVVNSQSFSFHEAFATLLEAVWFRDQFLAALSVVIEEETGS